MPKSGIQHHNVIEPWLQFLLDTVYEAMSPYPGEVLCGVGYTYSPGEQGGADEILIYPGGIEVEFGGYADGRNFYPGFFLDVTKILVKFNHVKGVGWSCPSSYNGFISPETRIAGLFQNRHVMLRVLSVPPFAASPAAQVDARTGIIKPLNNREAGGP